MCFNEAGRKSGFFVDTTLSFMHPSVRILAFLTFAVAVYGIRYQLLAFLLSFMLAAMPAVDLFRSAGKAGKSGRKSVRAEFLILLRRVRLILLFLALVYACNTPGEYVAGWDFPIVPTYEGIEAGVEQMLRLTAILAALAFMLAMTSREQLITGLYWLALPFRWFGVDAERFAVRLSLTLYYVEHGLRVSRENALQQLMMLNADPDGERNAPEQIVIEKPSLRAADGCVLLGLILSGVLLSCA
jgi:energy-coupling factor transporter transmembrane protein EcfT